MTFEIIPDSHRMIDDGGICESLSLVYSGCDPSQTRAGTPCACRASAMMRSAWLLQRVQGLRWAASSAATQTTSSLYASPVREYCSNNNTQPKRPRTAVRQADDKGDTFLSRYYNLAQGEVENYLTRHHLQFRRSGEHVVVEECPFCHPTKGKPSNLFKLYILSTTGVYMCHRCSAKGSWFSFRKRVGGVSGGTSAPIVQMRSAQKGNASQNGSHTGEEGSVEPEQQSENVSIESRDPVLDSTTPCPPRSSLKRYKENLYKNYPHVKDILNQTRGLRDEVLEKYNVGVEHFVFRDAETGNPSRHLCYMLPMFNSRRKLVRFKVRSVEQKSAMKLEPKGGDWGLFGLDTLPAGATEVVLTEGEFDAMAVHQATGLPAVSLPNGASSLPMELLPMLERFKKIYLWMDDDIPGQEGARQFSKKLGRKRCLSVRSGSTAKDANDALRQGLDLNALIAKASVVPHESISTFRELRQEVYSEFINPLQAQGMQAQTMPRYNEYLKGHRRGELSIFSGHTGIGKTTLLSQLSLDYCLQGRPTLWGSFELSNVKLAKLMLSQFYSYKTRRSAVSLAKDFEEWAERFEELPMYFMCYHGSNPIERVIDTMEYGNYVHDCSHVILDNLQFMTSGQSSSGRARGNFDRFEVMDNAVEKIRWFATQHNVHVSLVVHPRKENDDTAIQTASIFGSAKATQEADNVIILQRSKCGPLLDIRKNRFDGALGAVRLRFNKELKLFEERDVAKATSPLRQNLPAPPPVADKLFAKSVAHEWRW